MKQIRADVAMVVRTIGERVEVRGIGVDKDQYITLFGRGAVAGCEELLSSAMQRMHNAVFGAIADSASGAFTSGTELYDLAVEGVGLAPLYWVVT